MSKIKCSVRYHKTKNGTLSSFGVGVRDGIFNNPGLFPAPTITIAIFQVLIDNYVNAWSAYEHGGPAQKGAYDAATDALMAALDTLALYVDSVANGFGPTIATAGYTPTKGTSNVSPEPTQLENIKMIRIASGELQCESEKQDFAICYIGILTADAPLPAVFVLSDSGQLTINGSDPGPGPSTGIIDFSKGRRKKFINLTPGTTYFFTQFVINARGVGSMSDPKSIVCY